MYSTMFSTPEEGGRLGRGAGNTGWTPLAWARLLPNDLNSALAALYQRVPASQEDGKKRERWNNCQGSWKKNEAANEEI